MLLELNPLPVLECLVLILLNQHRLLFLIQSHLFLVNDPGFDSASGGSIVFDGIDDRVSRDLAVNSGDNFTVSAWIYPTLLGITRRAALS